MIRFWKALNDIYGWIMTASFVLILLIGVWQIYDNYYVFSHTIDNSVLRYKPGASDSSDGEQAPFTDDLVGWLTIDGTDIDYPVMQGSDNAEYLSKDPYGGYSATGSIFLDSRSSPDFTDSFSIIYGHHMDYGRLFGALDDFLDENYLSQHTSGTLIVGKDADVTYNIEVFAAMRVSAKEKTIFDLEKDEIRKFIHDNADILLNEREGDIIALSTCADATTTMRKVVFCRICR